MSMPLVLIMVGAGKGMRESPAGSIWQHLGAIGPEFRRVVAARALEALGHRPEGCELGDDVGALQPRIRVVDHVEGAGEGAQDLDVAARRRPDGVLDQALDRARAGGRLGTRVAL